MDPKLNTRVWSAGAIALMAVAGLLMAGGARQVVAWRGGNRMAQSNAFNGWFFASPWVTGFLIFVLGPALFSLYWSFTNYQIGDPIEWVGAKNYTDLFEDRNFITSLMNSLYMTVVGVPAQIFAGLGMAMLLNTQIRGQRIFRTIFYLPVLLASSTAVLFTWRLMLNPGGGVVNTILRWFNETPLRWAVGAFIWMTELTGAVFASLQSGNWTIFERILSNGFPNAERVPLWLGADGLAFLWNKPSVVLIMMWSAGAMMLIYLAALNGVPSTFYEAAKVDGATAWQRFRHITLPMITPATFYNLIIGMIATLQIFEPSVTLVRDGGQNQSLYFVAYYLWRTTFRFNEVGYGAAMSWVLLLIVLGLTAIQFRMSNRWVYYEGE
jgi:multiple sugar transport system permease protein